VADVLAGTVPARLVFTYRTADVVPAEDEATAAR